MPIPKPLPLMKHISNPEQFSEIEKYVDTKVRYLEAKTRNFRENLLPKWIKIYKGKPEVETKTFPWPEASNLVVQLAATHCDELLARVMSIYQSDQLYVAAALGDTEDGVGEDQREIIERFMSDMALSPLHLDLYRVEEVFNSSAIRYGTGVVKFPYKVETEQIYTGSEGSKFKEEVVFEGPRPENVPLNKFLIDTQCSTLRNANFIVHIATYKREDIKELIIKNRDEDGIFNVKILQDLLDNGPDRMGPAEMQSAQEEAKQMSNDYASASGEWDFYECWFSFYIGNKKYRIIAHYHLKSSKIVGGLFNYLPKNMAPFEDTKLAYDDDQYYGYGFIEMLESYQKEISTTHNQRIDNRNLANTGALRIDSGSKLAQTIEVYPGVVIPAMKDEVEAIAIGNTSAPIVTDDEMLTLSLAKDRSGIDPAVSGAGGGIVNPKRGNYSAQGTAMAMQQSNNRNNLRMSDMRSSHVRMGQKILEIYATFGIENQIRAYASQGPLLKRALENYRNGKLGLLIKPATASNNKELEKQNDMLLLQTMERMQMADQQMIAAISQQGAPPPLIEYMGQCIQAKNAIFRRILRSFEHQDVERLAPLPGIIKQMRESANGNANQQLSPQAQPGNGAIPLGSGNSFGGIPQIEAGNSGPPTGAGVPN